MTALAHDYIVAPPSTLTATVRGPLGPLSGATVYASGESAKTNSDGVAVLHLSPGTYDVKASATGYADETKSVEVTQDGTTVAFDLAPLFVPVGPPASRAALMAFAVVTLAQDEEEAIRLWQEHAPRAYRNLLTGGWRWSETDQDYTSSTGSTLDGRGMKNLSLTFALAVETTELESLAEQMAAGTITIEEWQIQSATILRELYVAQALIASGGHLTPEDVASIQGDVDAKTGLQFGMDRLDNFGTAIAEASPGAADAVQVTERSGWYGATSNTIYEGVRRNSHRRAKEPETGKLLYLYEKNILGEANRHCRDGEFTEGCIECTAAGWVPLDTLPLPGTRTCMFHCRCELSYILAPEDTDVSQL